MLLIRTSQSFDVSTTVDLFQRSSLRGDIRRLSSPTNNRLSAPITPGSQRQRRRGGSGGIQQQQ